MFLKVLPLKEDHEESMAVYSCICNLVLSSNPQVIFHFFLSKNLTLSLSLNGFLTFGCCYADFVFSSRVG